MAVIALTGAVVLALVIDLGPASAQRVIEPDSIERSEESTDIDIPDDTVDQTGQDDDDEEQQRDEESPFDSFDDLTVERVQPDEIPDFRPGLPEGPSSRMDTSDLPQSVSGEQLREVSHSVASSTVELVAVVIPEAPYRADPMLYRGHALWISPHRSGQEPQLIATSDWLEDADEIYAVDGTVSQALSEGGLELGGHEPQPLEDFSADAGQLLERYGDRLVALEIEEANRHVNLARLRGAGDTRIATPESGLVLHDMDHALPSAIFGYSPGIGSSVVPVGYRDSEHLERAYSFYFLVDFQAILGAPIVGSNGRLLGMTALRHPSQPEHTLAVPPGAIHSFVGTGRADGSDDDDS